MSDLSIVRNAQMQCERAGLELGRLVRRGAEVWLFGSRAGGCSRVDSDWDVLILDDEPVPARRRVGRLDIVTVTRAHALGAWRGSELAVHVARYGLALGSKMDWNLEVDVLAAAARKRNVVEARALRLGRTWEALPAPQRVREAVRLRLDLQRAACLISGGSVPPTAVLNRSWDALEGGAKQALVDSVVPHEPHCAVLRRSLVAPG